MFRFNTIILTCFQSSYMTSIKHVINSFCKISSSVIHPIQPETVRLCKFNDPTALKEIFPFLQSAVKFITGVQLLTVEEIRQFFEALGFPYYLEIERSSLSGLLALSWLISHHDLVGRIEKGILKDTTRCLTCYSLGKSGKIPRQSSQNDNVVEDLYYKHYRTNYLSKQIKSDVSEYKKSIKSVNSLEINKGFNYMLSLEEKENQAILSLGKVPNIETIPVPLEVYVSNNPDKVTQSVEEIESCVRLIDHLILWRTHYKLYWKWIMSAVHHKDFCLKPTRSHLGMLCESFKLKMESEPVKCTDSSILNESLLLPSRYVDNLGVEISLLDSRLSKLDAIIEVKRQNILKILNKQDKIELHNNILIRSNS